MKLLLVLFRGIMAVIPTARTSMPIPTTRRIQEDPEGKAKTNCVIFARLRDIQRVNVSRYIDTRIGIRRNMEPRLLHKFIHEKHHLKTNI